ncbi:hypothetical protein DH2020_028828 [Rehmannia glutinosa]|uniref:mitogen-activated protein kinase kinase kinase n=1 Tax=Rehmannia glutinosa TaxID=99300 RepID=A0ABR0VQ86_REHGL
MRSWWGSLLKKGRRNQIGKVSLVRCTGNALGPELLEDGVIQRGDLNRGQIPDLHHRPNKCHDVIVFELTEPSLDRGSNTSPFLFLPKPGHVKIKAHAVVGERDLATPSNSSDSSSDTDDPSDSRLLSPQASDYESGIKSDTTSPSGLKQRSQFPFTDKKNTKEMLKPANIFLNYQTRSASPRQKPVNSKVAHLQVPHQGALLNAPDSSMSSPSRSPMRVFGHDPVTNSGFWLGKPYADLSLMGSGHCSSPGSVHNSGNNSVAGDMPCQLFWPHSSGAVTPLHPRAGGPSAESPRARPDDGRQQSHPLPLPPVKVSNPSLFNPSYSTGTSPRIPRSPGRTDNPPSPGSRWKKGRLLGRGTFGHVYLGFNSESGEMCAMKEVTLFSDDAKSRESAQQFGQEIAFLSRLRHPNIVQYYGSETVDDKIYIYLEYVSGGSIHKILQEYGQLGEAAIRVTLNRFYLGWLICMPKTHFIGWDIKGANILVDPNGRVKLADFGMAKHITGHSCPLSFKGSPYWMAPEVIKNSSGCKLAVDIWSLGCTVLEMATTKPPWSQYEGVAAMFKIGNSKELPEIPDHLSDEGKDFVMQCLQRNPRYRPSAAQLLDHPFGFGHSGTPQCLDSPGAVNRSKSPKTVPGLSDGYMARNISCPVSPLGSPHLSHSRSPHRINGRLSPSPISSPRPASDASTPPPGPNRTTLPNYLHKPNIFRGIHRAHSSVETMKKTEAIVSVVSEALAANGAMKLSGFVPEFEVIMSLPVQLLAPSVIL